jgi:hypothetical protein
MAAFITQKGMRAIVLITFLGVVAVILTHLFGPAASQAKNLAAAREHASRLEPDLHRDSRFTNVHLGPYTGDGGCLWVNAYLTSDRDSNDLRQLVEASHPPVRTRYSIIVIPPDTETNR